MNEQRACSKHKHGTGWHPTLGKCDKCHTHGSIFYRHVASDADDVLTQAVSGLIGAAVSSAFDSSTTDSTSSSSSDYTSSSDSGFSGGGGGDGGGGGSSDSF